MDETVEFLRDVFRSLGTISARKMFGGYGVYLEQTMFALVADNTLYLKVGDSNRKQFEDRNLPAFTYMKKGKPVVMSYYQAPEEIYEDQDLAAEWARASLVVANKA